MTRHYNNVFWQAIKITLPRRTTINCFYTFSEADGLQGPPAKMLFFKVDTLQRPPAKKKNKAQDSGSSFSFWSLRLRDPPRTPPAALHAHITASPTSTSSRVPPPTNLLRERERERVMGRIVPSSPPPPPSTESSHQPPDLDALHRIPLDQACRMQDADHRRSEPTGRMAPIMAALCLGAWPHALERCSA
jgi:hypothetical protein